MSAPVPFIQLDSKTGQLRVTDEARASLSKVRGTVAVCAVAGVYRTGKSYILNQLAGQQSGFGVGSSVQACTKGIWMWGAPLQLEATTPGAPKYLLLLDTEGLASISQTEGHDAKIFCLALLLSSFFVYNSEKAINSAAIDQLSLVVQLIQKIRVHAEGAAAESQGAAELAAFFPKFVWLLRDFQLELKDEAGRELTPTQYLEECLRAQPGTSAAVAEQNSTRAAITRLFPQRGCIALPHPTLGTALPPSALKKLPTLDKLAPDFRDGVLDLKQQAAMTAPKTVNGTPLDGPMLLHLADAYVGAINGGALPTISTAWQAVLVIANQQAAEAAFAHYQAGLRAAAEREPPPDAAAWAAADGALQQEAMGIFRRAAVGTEGAEPEAAKLRARIEAERAQLAQLLAAKSEALCLRVASGLGAQLDAYEAPPDGSSHSDALPSLVRAVLAAYDEQAGGAAKGDGLRQLLDSKVLPLVGRVLRSSEADSKVLLAEQARLAAEVQRLEDERQQLLQQQQRADAERATAAERGAALEALLRSERASLEQQAAAALGEQRAQAAQQLGAAIALRDAAAARLAELEREQEARAAEARQVGGALAQAQAQAAQAQAEAVRERQQGLDAQQRATEARGEAEQLRAASAAHQRERDAAVAAAAAHQRDRDAAVAAAATAHATAATAQATANAANANAANANANAAATAAATAAPAAPASAAASRKKRQRVGEEEAAADEQMDTENDGNDAPLPPAAATVSSSKSPVDPSKLAVPVLQGKLRSKLGQKAALPKKKDELVKLYKKTFA
jgi:hypothetical protein